MGTFANKSALPGLKEADVDDTPTDGQGVVFNSAADKYEAQDLPGASGGEANDTSNVGTGAGLALPKVGIDLPFKSLTVDSTITQTVTATEIQHKVTTPFTTTEKTKLSNIEDNATIDQTGAEIKTAYEGESNAYTDTKNTKLSGIDTGAEVNLFSKYDATIAPTVDNDTTEGYVVGSKWVDVTNDKAYICVDNTDGVAVWIEITGGGSGGATDTEIWIPLTQTFPEGIGAFPLQDAMTSTINKTVSGFVFPDGASAIAINLKAVYPIPSGLATSPAARIRLVIKTMAAQTSKGIVLTIKRADIADGETFDFTSWTESMAKDRIPMPNTINLNETYDANFSTQPEAGDFPVFQIERDPTDSTTETTGDDFGGDIQLISAAMGIKVSN